MADLLDSYAERKLLPLTTEWRSGCWKLKFAVDINENYDFGGRGGLADGATRCFRQIDVDQAEHPL